MEPILLVCKSLHLEAFANEVFTGEDDILAIVEQGSFVFDNGSGPQQVGPLEGVNFKNSTNPLYLPLQRKSKQSNYSITGRIGKPKAFTRT